jgi:hypothetical protein
MHYHPSFGIIAAKPHLNKGIRETDIRDEYLPSPIVATISFKPPRRTHSVPLPTHCLVRRGHD